MNWPKLIACIVLSEIAGISGSIFNVASIPTWYATLAKPFFSPPNWIFGPVWTLLFAMMGISFYLVLEAKGKQLVKQKKLKKKNQNPLISIEALAFYFQFALNILWSFLFFGIRAPWLAFAEILLLWVSIAATIVLFGRVSKKAAWLFVPYIAWVSFATLLNLSIALLN